MGSDPADRMKMKGVRAEVSLYARPMSRGGTSTYSFPILLLMNSNTEGINFSSRIVLTSNSFWKSLKLSPLSPGIRSKYGSSDSTRISHSDEYMDMCSIMNLNREMDAASSLIFFHML